MNLPHNEYIDRIHGGWLGKCIGGTIGARFECVKEWIEIEPKDLFPETIPPNDDLDLQILWLKVLEEKGQHFTSEDLADAWLAGCWYPFNEYGVFRRHWRMGIAPPVSGSFANPFWGTGMGCPIRSEIWGYVCPGNPDLAADFAYRDGCLDHTEQSIAAERMWSAMAALAFTDHDMRSLIKRTFHYLPSGTPIATLSKMAIDGYDAGMPARAVRDRILANAPCAEACDAQINVPFTLLGLLYGEGDLEKTLIAALNCGYDTDCTLATAGALLGQLLGAKKIPQHLIDPIGDELVMGIQYRRDEMTISALTRDTARIGICFGQTISGNLAIADAPAVNPLPDYTPPPWHITTSYNQLPCAAPGDTVTVTVKAEGQLPGNVPITIDAPDGWEVTPSNATLNALAPELSLQLHLRRDTETVFQTNLFTIHAGAHAGAHASAQQHTFGIKGADCWQLLGVFFETTPVNELTQPQCRRSTTNNFVDPTKEYVAPDANGDALCQEWSTTIGQPAVLPIRELMLEPKALIPLKTAYSIYLERELIAPEDREIVLSLGHNVPLTAWINGEEVIQDQGETEWQPETTWINATLKEGANRLRIRLDRLGSDIEFSCMIRDRVELYPDKQWVHCYDYNVDLVETNPYRLLES